MSACDAGQDSASFLEQATLSHSLARSFASAQVGSTDDSVALPPYLTSPKFCHAPPRHEAGGGDAHPQGQRSGGGEGPDTVVTVSVSAVTSRTTQLL